MNIQPLPPKFGVGFFSNKPIHAPGTKYQQVGMYHNYHFTPENFAWPVPLKTGNALIDGFSPNLNKFLHAGHLKNLAVASAISKIAGQGKAVAMVGASLGIKEGAIEKLYEWFALAQYKPDIYLDTELPKPSLISLADGEGDKAGTKVFNGPKGPVVIYKSDGKTTYAAHDLAFASLVGPTHYLTGAEQKEHFESLGLGEKHMPLGLLLGADGKKMTSRTGEAVSAEEVFGEVLGCLKETPEPKKLAWNILAAQFNMGSKAGNTKFNLAQWAKPEAPGMYITYTYAKVNKALAKAVEDNPLDHSALPLLDNEVELAGTAAYFTHYFNKAVDELEPHHLAQYALALAKVMSKAYNTTPIVGGDPGFIKALSIANDTLKKCMEYLSMYPLTTV